MYLNIKEMIEKLDQYNVSRDWYCINEYAEETYFITYNDNKWQIGVMERGILNVYYTYKSEEKCCEKFFEIMMKSLERAKAKQRRKNKMEFYEMCEKNLLVGIVNYLYYKEKMNFNEVIDMLENSETITEKMDELQLDSAGKMAYLTFSIVPESERNEIIENVLNKVKKYIESNGDNAIEEIAKENIEQSQDKIDNLVQKVLDI